MINNVVLVGRLTKDVDLRYTGNDTAVGNFTLAIERPYTNGQGERESDFINCVIWRGKAENLANFTAKGSLIGITGSIQTRTYEHEQKGTVYITEVNADNFQLLEPKSVTDKRKNQASNNNQDYQQTNTQGNYNSQPQQQFRDAPDPFAQTNEKVEISESDLPF